MRYRHRFSGQVLSAAIVACLVLATTAAAQTTLVHYKFKFGAASVPAPAGYTKVTPANLYNKAYPADTVNGYFGFHNWQHNRLGAVDRGGSDTLHRDFITNFDSSGLGAFYHNSPFYFSVNVPEGKYRVAVTIGDPQDTAITTLKAESRRLIVKNLRTAPGRYVTRYFNAIRRDPAIKGTATSVGLDYSYGREDPNICLDWDRKLTIEFNGRRPCISAVEITQLPDSAGITIHLCGNSTLVEQEDEPWTAWGQMLPAFFDTAIFTNDLASSGLTSSSFLAQRRLAKICTMLRPGDYLFFEFGHNDSKSSGGISTTQFQANMQICYDSAQKHGATMVFVTPTARYGDNDSSTSIGGYAELTRTTAKSLGAKLIELNAAVIHMNTALGTSLYCRVAASQLWPDQPATDGTGSTSAEATHFCDYGGYELGRFIAQKGMKGAVLPLLTAHLLDSTLVFNVNNPPDTFSKWDLPYSTDTT